MAIAEEEIMLWGGFLVPCRGSGSGTDDFQHAAAKLRQSDTITTHEPKRSPLLS
jgi:hypothetical protein